MTITEFLEARIAEDESLAQAAFDEPLWGREDDGLWEANTSSRSPNVRGATFFHIEGGDPDCMGEGQAAHIARHDPARVLKECAAKRAIIQRVGPDENGSFPVRNLTIQLLMAAVYSDHPDYRQEWKP